MCLEGKRYEELKILRDHAGKVTRFLMQTVFPLPGGVKYKLDFLVFWSDGRITYEDVKGMRTKMYILKKKQTEALYKLEITEI